MHRAPRGPLAIVARSPLRGAARGRRGASPGWSCAARSGATRAPHGAVVVDGVELRYTQAGTGPPGGAHPRPARLDPRLRRRAERTLWRRDYQRDRLRPPRQRLQRGAAGRRPHADRPGLPAAPRRRPLGLERPVLVGYSLGAAVAVAYAELYPDDVAAVVTVGGHVLPYRLPISRLIRVLRVPVLGRLAAATVLVPAAYPVGYVLLRRACYPQPLPRRLRPRRAGRRAAPRAVPPRRRRPRARDRRPARAGRLVPPARGALRGARRAPTTASPRRPSRRPFTGGCATRA